LFHAIIFWFIIFYFISQYHPPPQTTAIYRDLKKSTAFSKGYNVGLRYIKLTNEKVRGTMIHKAG
jgi:hypothetical protein